MPSQSPQSPRFPANPEEGQPRRSGALHQPPGTPSPTSNGPSHVTKGRKGAIARPIPTQPAHKHSGGEALHHQASSSNSGGSGSGVKSLVGVATATQLLQFDDQAPLRLAAVLGVLLLLIICYMCCRLHSARRKRRREEILYQPLSVKEFGTAQISDLDSDDDDRVDFRVGERRIRK